MITRLRRRFFTAAVLAAVIAAIAAIVAAADTIDPGATGARYAWGENVGWINAKAPASGNPGVTVSGLKLTGYMWGENIGWINMNCTNNATCGSTGNYGVKNDGDWQSLRLRVGRERRLDQLLVSERAGDVREHRQLRRDDRSGAPACSAARRGARTSAGSCSITRRRRRTA